MRVVIDTNVVVSGLLSSGKACDQVIKRALTGAVEVCYSTGILAEYLKVLSRAAYHVDPLAVDALLDWIERDGLLVQPASLPALVDPSDTKFLEAAAAGGAAYLVTGNPKDFPGGAFRGVKILNPAEFLKTIDR